MLVSAMQQGGGVVGVEHINPPGLSRQATYSHVVKAGTTVYVAGQVARDETGGTVGPGDFPTQAVQVFENLGKALRAGGADFRHLVKITIYLTDPRYREALGKVRVQYIKDPVPASTLVVVAGLAEPDYLLEIEGIAVID
jgi:2-iminobutanoate/2-iminopropanoate deaminase